MKFKIEDLDNLEELNMRLEELSAPEIVDWALSGFGGTVAIAASFEDIVLIDLAVKLAPDIEVIFLDTKAHFPETMFFVEEIERRYDLNPTITTPGPDASEHPCGSAQCCQFRKVLPLQRALSSMNAWMTSLKRSDGPQRKEIPIVGIDTVFLGAAGQGLVKINPLAQWTSSDIANYLDEHHLPEHPLISMGYRSIGCAPTTTPTLQGDDPRSGRWSGQEKTECGLHIS